MPTEQAPAVQQAPLGGKQGSGVHELPLPWYAPPPAVHCAEVTIEQLVPAQQAPLAGAQGSGEHVVPLPW